MRNPTTPRERRVDLSSLLTGVAFGAVITMLATIAVVPEANPSGTGNGEGQLVAVPSEQTTPNQGGSGQQSPDQSEVTASGPATPQQRTAPAGGDGGTDPAAGGASESGVDLGTGGDGTGPASGSSGGGGGPGGGGCEGPKSQGVPGVTDSGIKLGATVVEDGFAARFLGEVPEALRAVTKKVNRQGGICGRTLDLITKNDNWDAQTGKRNIENLINDGVFAFAVSPSSEGLNAASKAGVFEREGVPVVGADGLNNTQFRDPMIWPVAAATTTTVHSIMKNAWDRCEQTGSCKELRPAIVFGNSYRFGVEGAFAFNAAYKELSGQDIPGYSKGETGCKQGSRYCGIASGQDTYTGPVSIINEACETDDGSNEDTGCNLLLILLEPDTALKFLGTSGAPEPADFDLGPSGDKCCGMAGAQPLFTANFADNCAENCEDMWVWTGYNPPIEQYAPERDEATRTYVDDLRSQSGSVDIANQFTEGGYIGMLLLVEALERIGNDLTRDALISTLNSMPPLDTGLSVPLQWTEDERYANHSAQAFSIPVANGWTGGWEFKAEYVQDPWLGQHNNI